MQELVTTYGRMIRRVARTTEYKTNPRYGYRLVTSDDIEQEVYLRLIEQEIDFDTIDVPEAWIRTTAKLAAYDLVHEALRRRDGTGIVNPADLSKLENKIPSTRGLPEPEVDHDESVRAVFDVIQRIVAKVQDPAQRGAIEGYYLGGAEKTSVAERKRRSRAHAQLEPEEVASLQAWRAWRFPEAKRPRTHAQHEATPVIEAAIRIP